ncbi:lipoprotein signal peptidase [Bacteroidota bacterium]
MKYTKFYILSLVIILIDQTVKLLVYYNMDMGLVGQIEIFDDWFKLHYTINPGMAFGMQIASEYGKLVLTSFRLVVMVGIVYYLFYLAKNGVHQGLIWCVALILGGAIGNVIDSTFYGIWLDNAPASANTPWFHGQVIDMFYIDIWEGRVADWIPIFGGDYMALWPIFNVADASIFIGVSIILFRQKAFFDEKKEKEVLSTGVHQSYETTDVMDTKSDDHSSG